MGAASSCVQNGGAHNGAARARSLGAPGRRATSGGAQLAAHLHRAGGGKLNCCRQTAGRIWLAGRLWWPAGGRHIGARPQVQPAGRAASGRLPRRPLAAQLGPAGTWSRAPVVGARLGGARAADRAPLAADKQMGAPAARGAHLTGRSGRQIDTRAHSLTDVGAGGRPAGSCPLPPISARRPHARQSGGYHLGAGPSAAQWARNEPRALLAARL